MSSKPEPTLNVSVSSVVSNGWLNIEHDEHPLYWVKGKISLSMHVFKNKVHNLLIMYLESQKRNSSNRISNLKEPWNDFNLKAIQSIFHPDQLHSRCHFPKEVAEYLSKRLNNVKDKYQKHQDDEFYTNNYEPVEVALGWIKEYIKSMESRTLSWEALIKRNNWFSDRNQYVDDYHLKWMKKFGHHVYEEEDGSSKYE